MNGFSNLYAMEIDPTSSLQEMIEQCQLPLSLASSLANKVEQRTRMALEAVLWAP